MLKESKAKNRKTKAKLFKALAALSLLAAVPILSIAINTLLEGYRITSTPQTVDAHGQCRIISKTGGPDFFVPTRTAAEYQSFLNNPVPNANIQNCSITGCKLRYRLQDSLGNISAWQETPFGGTGNGNWVFGPTVVTNYLGTSKLQVGVFCAPDSYLKMGYKIRGNQGPYWDNGMTVISSIANQWVDGAWSGTGSYSCAIQGGDGACGTAVKDYATTGCTTRVEILNSDNTLRDFDTGDQSYYSKAATTGYAKIRYGIKCVSYPSVQAKQIVQCGADWSSLTNNYGGFYNGRVVRNFSAFAALKNDGSIVAWGDANAGGTGAPTGTGFVKIYPNGGAFAAIKSDGSVTAWGNANAGGTGAPTGTGFVDISSTSVTVYLYKTLNSVNGAFAALKNDGSIVAWGDANYGGSGAPTGAGFVKIYSNAGAFAALKNDGSIVAWGNAGYGGTGAPTGTGFVKIFATERAFAALKNDGSIVAWGDANYGGSGAPGATGIQEIYSNSCAFAALTSQGVILSWGGSSCGGSSAPTGGGFVRIYATETAFAALKNDGSIVAWGDANYGGSGAPTGAGFVEIYSNWGAFAALRSDGTIVSWGDSLRGGGSAPTGTGFVNIYSNGSAFAALKSDGSLVTWGASDAGGASGPAGTGFVNVIGGAQPCNNPL